MSTQPKRERSTGGMSNVPLLSRLNRDQMRLVVPLLQEVRYPAGKLIFERDEDSFDVYLLEQGIVTLYRDTVYGPQPLAELEGGSLFGEISLLDGGKRSSTAQAKTFVTLWKLSGIRLQALFQREPALAFPFYRAFWSSLAIRINMANANMLRFFSAKECAQEGLDDDLAGEHPASLLGGFSSDSKIIDHRQIGIDPEAKKSALKQSGLTEREIELLFQYGEQVGFPSGSVIFREGEFGESLYFILAGEVRISKDIPDIGEEVLAFLKAGEIFGEMALVSKKSKRTADCYAHGGPVLLLGFSQTRLNQLQWTIENELPFLNALCKMMARRLREIEEKLYTWKMMSGGC